MSGQSAATSWLPSVQRKVTRLRGWPADLSFLAARSGWIDIGSYRAHQGTSIDRNLTCTDTIPGSVSSLGRVVVACPYGRKK